MVDSNTLSKIQELKCYVLPGHVRDDDDGHVRRIHSPMVNVIIVVEKIREVSALVQPKSSIKATKNMEKERRMPKATIRIMLLIPTIIQP